MKDLISQLHPLERMVLPQITEGITLIELIEKTELKEVEVLRALQWLSNKQAVHVITHVSEWVQLDVNGETALKQGLPERRFLKALATGKKL